MFIENEYFISACEYDEGSFVVQVADTDILLVENWIVQKVIAETDAGNTMKYWFKPIPHFHPVHFPFIVCSGKIAFNLINLNTGKMQELIYGSA